MKHNNSDFGLVDGKYELKQKLGAGNFGEIRLCRNVITGKNYAIKLESVKARSHQLHYEFQYYKMLCPHDGVPNVYFYGLQGPNHLLVLDLLGPSIENHFDACERIFSPKKVAIIAVQLFPLISYVHSKGIIYRDIKPENFLLGLGDKSRVVHIVDFGLSKMYKDVKTGVHIPYREQKNLTGTARYMSINTHKGREQSRRDDLEAISHMLFYFLRGSLPWQGLQADTVKERYQKIGQKKMTTSVEKLCQGFPDQFGTLLSYARNLMFEQDPDYDYLVNLMKDVLSRYSDECEEDWAVINTSLSSFYDGKINSNIPLKVYKSKWSKFCSVFKRRKNKL